MSVALLAGAYAGYRIVWGHPFNSNQLDNRQAVFFLVRNPEMFTTVGIADGTLFDRHSGRLAAVGIEKRDADFAFAEQALAEVREFDRAKLDPQEQITYGVLLDFYGGQAEFRRFPWLSSEGLYPISPMSGTQVQLAGFWKLIERHRVSYFSAAPMPPEVFRRFEKLTGLEILEGYGLTEATCATSINPPAGERRIGSVGLAMPFQKVKAAIVGADGRLVRECAGEEGWLNTGDLCRIDNDGYIWLTGRAKDLIIRGGHNIDPQMIEEVLVTHPAVAMAAAVGQPDAYAGELPMAFVAARPGTAPTPEELIGYCRERIAERAAVPVRVVVLPALPVTAVGKTFKPELRRHAIEAVYTEALAARGITATVAAGPDERFGTLATVTLDDPARAPDAEQVLGAFAVRSRLA